MESRSLVKAFFPFRPHQQSGGNDAQVGFKKASALSHIFLGEDRFVLDRRPRNAEAEGQEKFLRHLPVPLPGKRGRSGDKDSFCHFGEDEGAERKPGFNGLPEPHFVAEQIACRQLSTSRLATTFW
jgi:hypothetical protein